MNIDVEKAASTAQAIQNAVASETKQIRNESEMDSSSSKKDSNSSQKKGKNRKQDGVAQLRERLEKSRSELESVKEKSRNRLANTPNIRIKEDSIDLEYSVTVDKQKYTSALPVVKGDVAKALLPVISPFVKVANAALQAQDLRELKQAHTRDNDGRPTKEVLRHAGKVTLVTNPIDDLRYQWEVIAASPAAMKALQAFAKEVEKLDFSVTPGITTADLHRDSYRSGTELSATLNEYKYSSPVKGETSDFPSF